MNRSVTVEESVLAPESAVYELVNNDKLGGLDLSPQ
jgi:hypothetical protein